LGFLVVQANDDADQLILAERDDDPAPYDRRLAFGDAIGKVRIQRNRKGNIAELGHG
jgi:hypothetical protein